MPSIDYHVHLLGPYALPVVEPLPELMLPPALSKLLADWGRLYGRVTELGELADVFTPDALLLDAFIDTRWLRDKAEFVAYLGLFTGSSALRFVANAYDVSGRSGHIAGTIADAETGQHHLHFLVGISRGKDGTWRIASEIVTPKNPPRYSQPITAEQLIADLDEAGIQRALVLSEAFWIGGPGSATKRLVPAKDEQTAVQLEND